MRAVRFLPRFLAAAVLLAEGAGCTRHPDVAPTSQTVVSSTEERAGDPPSHVVFVENRSTVPVVLYRTSVTECENVSDSCTPQPMNRRLAPGRKEIVLRIQPVDPARHFRYRFAYSWRAGTMDMTTVTILAGSPDVRAEQDALIQKQGDSVRKLEAAAGYAFIGRDDYTPLAGRVAAMRAVGDSIVLATGQTGNIDKLRFVLVDADGHVLGSTLWVQWKVPPGRTIQFVSGKEFVGRTPGRALLTFSLADEAQRMLGQTVGDVIVPIVVVADTLPAAAAAAPDVDLSGAWATGSTSEPAVPRVVLQLQCNHTPSFWIIEQRGDSVRAFTNPESRAQGILAPDRVQPVTAEGRMVGSLITMSAPGSRYMLRYDPASGHLRGTLNDRPFWAVRQENVRPTGCIAVP